MLADYLAAEPLIVARLRDQVPPVLTELNTTPPSGNDPGVALCPHPGSPTQLNREPLRGLHTGDGLENPRAYHGNQSC